MRRFFRAPALCFEQKEVKTMYTPIKRERMNNMNKMKTINQTGKYLMFSMKLSFPFNSDLVCVIASGIFSTRLW